MDYERELIRTGRQGQASLESNMSKVWFFSLKKKTTMTKVLPLEAYYYSLKFPTVDSQTSGVYFEDIKEIDNAGVLCVACLELGKSAVEP